jgi:hypothetical protein
MEAMPELLFVASAGTAAAAALLVLRARIIIVTVFTAAGPAPIIMFSNFQSLHQ